VIKGIFGANKYGVPRMSLTFSIFCSIIGALLVHLFYLGALFVHLFNLLIRRVINYGVVA
jgi:hypothetical protein